MNTARTTSIAFSVDRLVVIELDDTLLWVDAVRKARYAAAAEFARMLNTYDGDEETIIVLEEYSDE